MDTEQITYRAPERRDYPALAEIIRKTWNYDKLCRKEATAGRMARLYLWSCLAQHTWARVAVQGERTLGIIMAQSAHALRPAALRYRLGAALRALPLLLTRDGRRVANTYRGIDGIDKALLEGCGVEFDGELVFFALDEGARGRGVGKRLFEMAKCYLRSESVERFYLYTDTSCNYHFYEGQGMARIGEKRMPLPSPPGGEFCFYLYQLALK